MDVVNSNQSWGVDPNEKVYTGARKNKYITTRLVVHSGIAVAIALRRDSETDRLTFDYAVLDPSGLDGNRVDKEQAEKDEKKATGDLLDSQGWTDTPMILPFPNEVRIVGEEAIPSLRLPLVDKSGQKTTPERSQRLDPWCSSTLCLTDDVPGFEVVSDGISRQKEERHR
jgi:hypothetical protein